MWVGGDGGSASPLSNSESQVMAKKLATSFPGSLIFPPPGASSAAFVKPYRLGLTARFQVALNKCYL